MTSPKNKTLASFFAFFFGSVGVHRFYLRGIADRWGWVHASNIILSGVAMRLWPDAPVLFSASPLVVSQLAAFIQTFVLGLTPDEQWDAKYRPAPAKPSRSGWPLAILLVLTVGVGAVALIGVMARMLDLLFTGGAYG